MLRRNRYRRGPYALAEPAGFPRPLKALIWLLVLGVVLWYLLKWIFGLFGAGDALQRKAVALAVEPGGTVSVSIEGGLMKKTDVGVPLYAGDKLSTSGNGHATLSFFDGTKIRLDANTDLTVNESVQGEEESTIELSLERGSLWLETPAARVFSGAITRSIETPAMTVSVAGQAEAVLSERALLVFSSDGLGLPVQVSGASEAMYVGEGQKLVLPEGATATGDLYAYRSALDTASQQQAFVLESRGAARAGTGTVATTSILTLSAPQNGEIIDGQSVTVQGKASLGAAKVRVNGVAVSFDRASGNFSQTLVLDQPTFEIVVEALNAQDNVIATLRRTVKRKAVSAVASPSISAPGKNGETYRTSESEIVLRGTNSASAAGIMVNEYRLQLFTPGKGSWSYLASARLGNLKTGTNVFNIYALDAQGNKSDPATLTIVYDDGTLPAPSAGSGASSAPAQIAETSLPQNAPLTPGMLKVTGPTAGTAHTATGSEFLLEGTTSADTASVWINGYRLQLYTPGKTFWNYIASTAFQTLKKGTNLYTIVARNAKNEILDRMEYTVTY
jgi:hypothetical protein